jgi:hypothetical protein
MVPFSLVYFEGQWLDEDAVLIEGAAERVETAFFPEWDSDLDAPWGLSPTMPGPPACTSPPGRAAST